MERKINCHVINSPCKMPGNNCGKCHFANVAIRAQVEGSLQMVYPVISDYRIELNEEEKVATALWGNQPIAEVREGILDSSKFDL